MAREEAERSAPKPPPAPKAKGKVEAKVKVEAKPAKAAVPSAIAGPSSAQPPSSPVAPGTLRIPQDALPVKFTTPTGARTEFTVVLVSQADWEAELDRMEQRWRLMLRAGHTKMPSQEILAKAEGARFAEET